MMYVLYDVVLSTLSTYARQKSKFFLDKPIGAAPRWHLGGH
jgi:hypothetical protein